MADRNQVRIQRDDGYADTDPLAELTRIMGFDPRVEPAPPMNDDFSIDLERELMGEFEAELHGDEFAGANSVSDEPAAYDRRYAPVAQAEPAPPAFEPKSGEDEFDDVLAASLEEEFALDVEHWQPETAGDNAFELTPETACHPANATDAAVDMDFSGQLSPAADEPAPIADAPFFEETAAAVEIPDLEAELGELLGALGASHEEAGAGRPAAEDAKAGFELALSAEDETLDSEETPSVGGEEFAGWERAASSYEGDGDDLADRFETPGAKDSSSLTNDRQVVSGEYGQPISADIEDGNEAAGYKEEVDAGHARAQDESPRDELFEQMFEPAAPAHSDWENTSRDQPAGEMSSGPLPESFLDTEIDFFADSDQEQVDDLLTDFSIDGVHDPLPETAAVETELFFAADESVRVAQGAEEPVFDDSAFEAALVGELAAVDFAPESYDEPALEAAVEEPRDDPFAALSSMGLPKSVVPAGARAYDYSAEVAAAEDNGGEVHEDAPSHAAWLAPEIETVEVPERAVALADDLDIPVMRFENDAPTAVAYDDLDAQFSSAFSAFDQPADAVGPEDDAGRTAGVDEFDEDFDRLFQVEDDFNDAVDLPVAHAASASDYGAQPAPSGHQAPPSHAMLPASGDYTEANGDAALVYDPAYDSGMAESPATADQPPRNRGFVVAAVVCGLAFAGGVGAFAYSVGGGEDGAPALVKADNGPVKVKPENPGGTVVPNQDSKVYERVSGGPLDAPSQEKLISGAEEPVELAPRVAEPVSAPQAADLAENLPGVSLAPIEAAPAESLPAPKAEDRVAASPDIESVIANEEIAAVAPRRVRTMIVRPDGTLVPREDPAPAATAPAAQQQPQPGSEAGTLEQPATPAPALAPISAAPAEVAAQPAVMETPPFAAAPAAGQPTAPPAAVAGQPAPAVAQGEAATPARVPVAPSRPGDQPVDIVGEVRARGQVASLEPQAPATAAAGSWMMQIASQPSPDGAQATYEDLAGRYGNILSGRGVNIVKAEIAGKGTFWRVRIPASSRDDAIQLCESYKGAGGSCFVSR